MSKSQRTGQKTSGTNRNGVRPKYIPLGTDADGATHTYRTTDRAVIAVADGAREHVESLPSSASLDDWMDFVADKRGWADRRYGIGLVEMLAGQLEGQ
jgi:hypothetical protein